MISLHFIYYFKINNLDIYNHNFKLFKLINLDNYNFLIPISPI